MQHGHYGNRTDGQYNDPDSGQYHNRHNGYFQYPPLGQNSNLSNGSLNDAPYTLHDSVQYGQHHDPQNGLLIIAPYEHQNSAQYGQHNNYPYGPNRYPQPNPQFTAPQAANDRVMRLDAELHQHKSTIKDLRKGCDIYRRERDDALQNAERLASELWENGVHDAHEKAEQMEKKAEEMERRAHDAETKVWELRLKITHLEVTLGQHGKTVEVQREFIEKTATVKKEFQTPRRSFTGAAEERFHVYDDGSPVNIRPARRERRAAPNVSFVPPPMLELTSHTGRSTTAAPNDYKQLPGDMSWRTDDAAVSLTENDSMLESRRTAFHTSANTQTLTPSGHNPVTLHNWAPSSLSRLPVSNAWNHPLSYRPAELISDSMGFDCPPPALTGPPSQGNYPNINSRAMVLYQNRVPEPQWSQQFDTLFRKVETFTAMYTHIPNDDIENVLSDSLGGIFQEFTIDATARKLLHDPQRRHFIVARLINANLATKVLCIKIMEGFSGITDKRIKNIRYRIADPWHVKVYNAAFYDLADTASKLQALPGFDYWMNRKLDSIRICFWGFVSKLLAPNVNHDDAYEAFKEIYKDAAQISLRTARYPVKFQLTFPDAFNPARFNPTAHLNVDPLIRDNPRTLVDAEYHLRLAVSPLVEIINPRSIAWGPKKCHFSRVILRSKSALHEEQVRHHFHA